MCQKCNSFFTLCKNGAEGGRGGASGASSIRIPDSRPTSESSDAMIQAFRNSDEETGETGNRQINVVVVVGKMFFMELVNFVLLRDKGRRHHAKHNVSFFDLQKASTSV